VSAPASWRSQSVTVAATPAAATASVTTPTGFSSGGATARVVNNSNGAVAFQFGVGAQVAVLPLPGTPSTATMVNAGATSYIDIPANADSFATISNNGAPAGNVYVQRGEGTGP
jgi:hypothetical protein